LGSRRDNTQEDSRRQSGAPLRLLADR
jgi:hypothetical protein